MLAKSWQLVGRIMESLLFNVNTERTTEKNASTD